MGDSESEGINVLSEAYRKGLISREEYLSRLGERGFTAIDVFYRSPSSRDLIDRSTRKLGAEAGPDVEASCVIAEWKKGRNSTEISRLLGLPKEYVVNIIRSEIREHPQQAPKEETTKPQTSSRLEALKKEMKDRNQK